MELKAALKRLERGKGRERERERMQLIIIIVLIQVKQACFKRLTRVGG